MSDGLRILDRTLGTRHWYLYGARTMEGRLAGNNESFKCTEPQASTRTVSPRHCLAVHALTYRKILLDRSIS